MVKVLIGDMFDSGAQTLVNTVNCVGVMGKGIALEFKRRFPEAFKDYEARCHRREVKLGRPYLYKSVVPPWILQFPTKHHWRMVARLDDIIRGLEYLLENYSRWGIESLAVPPLGCGQGQLEWRIVGPTLYRYLNKMGIPVELYAPYGTPHEELQPQFLVGEPVRTGASSPMPDPQWVRPAWVALAEILRRLEEQPYHWPVGRTIFQKIAYVATNEGLPTGLEYRRGSFGPFAAGIKKLESALINNGLIREEPLGRHMLAIKVGRTFEDARKAYAPDLKRWEPIIEKTIDLFMRLDTRQAELTATVLFAARGLEGTTSGKPAERDVLDAVLQWKQRRKPALSPPEVAFTIRNLAALGWLRVRPSNDLPIPKEEAISA
jgi:O-acetyl-ADP-ribose deacetylase (regulator of RNase III)/uncharacterized protein YwgA